MRTLTVSIIALAALAAVSQDRPPKTIVVPSTTAAVGPQWEKGAVEGGTYKNASVGLEVTQAVGLEFGTPELEGNPGTLPLIVTITALGENKPGIARKVMAFYTDALAYYPSTYRSTDDYMRRIVRSQQNGGYQPIEATPYAMLGGVAFARQDFKKGMVYESVLVKACDIQALVFIFGGADEETVNQLSAATELKLDPTTSGCFSNAAMTQDKPANASSSTTAESAGKHSGQSSPDEGYVSGTTFTSKFFAFTYKIPEGLMPQSAQLQQHSIDPSHAPAKDFVLLLAAKPTKPYENVLIHAQGSARFKDGAEYLESVASTYARLGVTVLDGPEKKTIGGTTFFREDSYSPKGSFYQTQVCTTSKGYVLDFVLSATNRADIEQLFNSLNTIQFLSAGQE